jgi:hypothetical protein
MNYLHEIVAKKMELSKYEVDALLRIVSQEIIASIKEGKTLHVEGLGFFYPKIMDHGLGIGLNLIKDVSEQLNIVDQKERKDEIIFE